ncbi:hypothetical protein DIE11_34080 [Burkholderia sp. Bp9012]|nr:hypothetical protein DIE11_34080 [Burkholderia sp. Bp9012]RQZ60956.1 hypothetical protein DIE08_29760 [Burkholderia sp. Bp9004]
MRHWNTVFGILGGIAIVIMVSLFGATSAGTQTYKPDFMASWVQATGGIVAIFASAIMVKWQFDKQRLQQENDKAESIRKRARYLRQVASEASAVADQLLTNLRDPESTFEYLQNLYDPNRLEVVGVALREIPVLELPSPEFVMPIIAIRTACERIADAARALKDAKVPGLSAYPNVLQMPEHAVVVSQAGYIKYSMELIESLIWTHHRE